MVGLRNIAKRFTAHKGGAAALEFAIIGPMLVVLLLGILSYGGYFWLSHALQQLANDAARAALGGLDSAERQALASASMASQLGDYPYLDPASANLNLNIQSDRLTVSLAYNASNTPFWALSSLVPMPSSTIVRKAAVRLGGY